MTVFKNKNMTPTDVAHTSNATITARVNFVSKTFFYIVPNHILMYDQIQEIDPENM